MPVDVHDLRALTVHLHTGYGAIYHHVADKNDLLAATADDLITRVLSGKDPRETLRRLVLGLFDAARTAITDGLRWLARHRLLRTLAILLGVNTFCGQFATATLVLLATETLHVSTAGYGLLLAGAAFGGLLGGLVNARIVSAFGALPALLGALAGNVVVFAAIGLSPDAVVLGVLLAANGFATTLWNVVTVSLRQQVVPDGLLGRVTSGYKLLGKGLIPLGTLTGGLVAHAFGLRAPYPVAGVVRGLALLAALPVLVRALRTKSAG